MEQTMLEQLPPVEVYAIAPQQAEQAAPLLTAEAADLLRAGEAFALAVVEEGEARGAVCARLEPDNEIVLELLSLYVIPQYRRRCLGGTLLMELLEACGDEFDGSIARVEAGFSPEPGLEAFLQKAGFQFEAADAHTRRIPAVSLADSPLMRRSGVPPKGHTLMPLEKMLPVQIRQLSQALAQAGVDYLGTHQLSNAVPGVSYVLLDAKGQPVACAVFTGSANRPCLAQFFAAKGKVPYALPVLRAAAEALLREYPGAELEIPLLTRSSAKLVERLLGSAGEKSPLLHAVLEL